MGISILVSSSIFYCYSAGSDNFVGLFGTALSVSDTAGDTSATVYMARTKSPKAGARVTGFIAVALVFRSASGP
jgi:hypothetical protein